MLNKLTAAVCAHVVAAVGCQAGRARGEPEAGGARPARVGGALMPSVYRFFRTFVIMSVWLPGGVLVCGMGMSDRCCDMDSDILWPALVACVAHTSRGLFACGRARVDGGRKFIASPACLIIYSTKRRPHQTYRYDA